MKAITLRAMNDAWAALLFRPEQVTDDALALGFALALAGYEVEGARLEIAALAESPGWSAAFYTSGVRRPGHTPEDELAHQRDVFTGDALTPAIGVRLAARRADGEEVTVHTLVHGADGADDVGESLEANEEDEDELAIDDELDDAEEDDDEDDAPPSDSAAARLGEAFGRPLLVDLTRALFQADKTLWPRLAPPEPAFVKATTKALVAALHRVEGRASFAPAALAGFAPPPSYEAFASTYDFSDPDDPRDFYRELAIGRIDGTLRFFRGGEASAAVARRGYPIGELFSSHLSSPQRLATLVLLADGARLALVDDHGRSREAGPTFAELLRYLALGYAHRTELEEEIISALMLRAAVRVA